jgi:NADH-quinone oxidoreductase subunit N
LGAINQINLKKMFAYSSVSNIGFIMALFPTVTVESYTAIIFNIFLYCVSAFFFWGLLAVFEYNLDLNIKSFKDLSGLYHSGRSGQRNSVYLLIFLFSSMGLPPLAGFFGKLVLFHQLIVHGHYWLI